MFSDCCCSEDSSSHEQIHSVVVATDEFHPSMVSVNVRSDAYHTKAYLNGTVADKLQPTLVNLRLRDGADSGPCEAASEKKFLNEPPPFSVRSVKSDSTTSEAMSMSEEQKTAELTALKGMMTEFVKELLQGIILNVVLEDGQLVPCLCSLDHGLGTLALRLSEVVRQIKLVEILEICSGRELRHLRTPTPLDDLCVTLVLKSDMCVSFKFKTIENREKFATSLKVLRVAQEAAADE